MIVGAASWNDNYRVRNAKSGMVLMIWRRGQCCETTIHVRSSRREDISRVLYTLLFIRRETKSGVSFFWINVFSQPEQISTAEERYTLTILRGANRGDADMHAAKDKILEDLGIDTRIANRSTDISIFSLFLGAGNITAEQKVLALEPPVI